MCVTNIHDMEGGFCGVYIPSIKCKADLMKYCLEATSRKNKNGYVIHDLTKAKKLYDFVTAEVSLPDVEAPAGNELYGALAQILQTKL